MFIPGTLVFDNRGLTKIIVFFVHERFSDRKIATFLSCKSFRKSLRARIVVVEPEVMEDVFCFPVFNWRGL